MGKPKKVKVCIRFVPLATRGSKVDQARLGLVQFKPVLAKPFAQRCQHSACIAFTFKRHYKIIRISDQLTAAPQTRLHHLLKPMGQN